MEMAPVSAAWLTAFPRITGSRAASSWAEGSYASGISCSAALW